MSDYIVGMMWNRNEGDILEEIITNALPHIDSLFIADDNSTDSSWEIIKSFAKHPKVEYVRNRRDDPRDQGQRQSMLDEIRRRYKPENTLVQIYESDMMILETDIRESFSTHADYGISLSWQVLNAVRLPGTWKEVDTYPNWPENIAKIMGHAHRMEVMTYTFRPLPKLYYNLDTWRPWPQGFSYYIQNARTDGVGDVVGVKMNDGKRRYSPLLAHYGYRGPKHFFKKFHLDKGLKTDKSGTWDLTSIEAIERTVPFFNGGWNGGAHEMSRKGWKKSRSSRQWGDE